MVGVKNIWLTGEADYQKPLQVIEGPDEPTITFPMIMKPRETIDMKTALEEISRLAAQPTDINEQSTIRKLLDANGGAINLKNMPMRTVHDFSDFLGALAGKGDHAWYPHTDVGMEVLRKPLAKYVLTTNEGPPTHFIGWHNEYAVSPVHPGYLILFCEIPPASGGETSIVSSEALYDRLKKEVPDFVEGCRSKGLVYHIPHTATQVGGIVGGNGLYKASAFGPKDGSAPPTTLGEKRRGVEARVIELAERGGWNKDIESDEDKPIWQRRGFNWTWFDNGDLEVTHRVPGVRVHPTLNRGSIFNAMSTRYTNAAVNDTFGKPPYTFTNPDGTEGVAIPPHFAGLHEDEPIPRAWVEAMDKYQHSLEASVKWEAGDVLILDNFAVQHARWAWGGERKIHASFWDQAGIVGEPMAEHT